MKIIDPDNSILKGRLVCRDDHPNDNIKVLQRMFPCDERMVLVVDDRVDVWQTPQNVLKIYKYDFWPSDADDNTDLMSPGIHGTQPTPDEDWQIECLRQRNHDNILGTTANILQAVHRVYYFKADLYRQMKVCAHVIYSQLQKRVFYGVHLVFSGVFPNSSAPHKTQEWKLAEQYGAKCYMTLNDKITHVVAARAGTAKVHRARKMDIYVVHINWLRQSIIHFVRMFEPDFPIGSRVKTANVSAHCSRPIEVVPLSNFLLVDSAKPRLYRPSELHMPELDPTNPKFNHQKYQKYKYFVMQQKELLRIKGQKNKS
eukprot:UN25441